MTLNIKITKDEEFTKGKKIREVDTFGDFAVYHQKTEWIDFLGIWKQGTNSLNLIIAIANKFECEFIDDGEYIIPVVKGAK